MQQAAKRILLPPMKIYALTFSSGLFLLTVIAIGGSLPFRRCLKNKDNKVRAKLNAEIGS